MGKKDVDTGEDPGSLFVEVCYLSVDSQELVEQLWRGGEGSVHVPAEAVPKDPQVLRSPEDDDSAFVLFIVEE